MELFIEQKVDHEDRPHFSIGKSNPNASNKQIMTKVMEQYHSKGLYVLKQVADNKWVPVLDKISGQQLQQAIQIIQSKNENGLNK